MEVVIVADAAAAGERVGDAVTGLLTRRPGTVLGLATGSSPLPVYRDLARRHRAGAMTFAHTSVRRTSAARTDQREHNGTSTGAHGRT